MNWQDRNMTARQFKQALKTLSISQASAGRYLGVSERTANRYCKGTAAVPPASAMLLRALIHYGVKPLAPKWVSPIEGRRD